MKICNVIDNRHKLVLTNSNYILSTSVLNSHKITYLQISFRSKVAWMLVLLNALAVKDTFHMFWEIVWNVDISGFHIFFGSVV